MFDETLYNLQLCELMLQQFMFTTLHTSFPVLPAFGHTTRVEFGLTAAPGC